MRRFWPPPRPSSGGVGPRWGQKTEDGFEDLAVLEGSGNPVAVLIADLDGENGPDIVTANGAELAEQCNDCNGTADLSVFWNQGGDVATPANWSRTDLAVEGPPTSVAAADLDGDTDMDLVSVSPDGSVSVLHNDGSGDFTRTDIEPTDDFFPRSVTIGDLDGDGRPDIITANRDAHDVSVFLQVTDGTFAARVDFAAGTEPAAVAVSDMDGDSDLDVVTANRSGTISVLSNRREEHRLHRHGARLRRPELRGHRLPLRLRERDLLRPQQRCRSARAVGLRAPSHRTVPAGVDRT